MLDTNVSRAANALPEAQRDVFVCENPNIVAIAADRLGTACAPLACTDGMPSAAQQTLLAQLAACETATVVSTIASALRPTP